MKTPLIFKAGFVALVALSTSLSAQPPAQAWEIGPLVRGRNYSEGMPPSPRPAPGGALAFDFPLAGSGQIDALTTAVGPLNRAKQITVRYRIDASSRTRFIPDEAPNERATVSLYFQQRGDNWSANGRYGSYRWYAPVSAVVPLAPGTYSMTVRLDEIWANVNGVPASRDARGYAFALDDTARIGLAFGSVGLRSHGVYTTGPARFTLLSFDIR